MSQLIRSFTFGDFSAVYLQNDQGRAVLSLLPGDLPCDWSCKENCGALKNASLVHLQLSHQNPGMFSNSYKLSESLDELQFLAQTVEEDEARVTVITTEEAPEGYGIRHHLTWYRGEPGAEVYTEFYNHSNRAMKLEYLTSASLDALSPYLPDEGSKNLVFHRFKAGWSMEGLLQSDTLSALGLESAWGMAGESLKLGAIGSRPVREYHPYGAVEDTANGVCWGVYLAHNASWQMELSRAGKGVSLSIGLADWQTGMWRKAVAPGESFASPAASVSVARGGIAELSNRMLALRHREIDAYGEKFDMAITYNDFVTTWGKPTEEGMLKTADFLKKGKTKYLVMDAGWYTPTRAIGDWTVKQDAFPHGMKYYTDEVRKRGMIPGIWMEYECTDSHANTYSSDFDLHKLTKDGHVIVGHVINGRKESFWDLRQPQVIDYLDRKVIAFLRDNGFGYLKVDYNASIGVGIDGEDSPGENLRVHMALVRDYFKKIHREIPDILIENCASGGCRLEPSMMAVSGMSSASDTHEVYECIVVAANLQYLTPPRQNQIWCTLHPEYSPERFSYVISGGFLGRICWSGRILELNVAQQQALFDAEIFYEKVAHIIKRGNSFIERSDACSFHAPTGSQLVLRYSEDEQELLIVAHSFARAKEMTVSLKGEYECSESLYDSDIQLDGTTLTFRPKADFAGNVYYLHRK